MAPIVAPSTFDMTTSPITSLSSSIYGPSLVTFLNETQAYATLDIIKTNLTKVSWCTFY